MAMLKVKKGPSAFLNVTPIAQQVVGHKSKEAMASLDFSHDCEKRLNHTLLRAVYRSTPKLITL
jgi:hypothetical protein